MYIICMSYMLYKQSQLFSCVWLDWCLVGLVVTSPASSTVLIEIIGTDAKIAMDEFTSLNKPLLATCTCTGITILMVLLINTWPILLVIAVRAVVHIVVPHRDTYGPVIQAFTYTCTIL